jgi:plastocyanin
MEEHMRHSYSWVVIVAVLCMGLTACAGLKTSRSGEIHTVNIETEPHPADMTVNVGDEVRWVNHRSMPVYLELVGDVHDSLSCERGFSNFLGMKSESVKIKPDNSVSACFSSVGLIKYNLRMEAAVPGGKQIASGTVQVGNPKNR